MLQNKTENETIQKSNESNKIQIKKINRQQRFGVLKK